MDIREKLTQEYDEELLFADGFDEAIIGVCSRFGQEDIVAYDYEKCIDILIKRDGMDDEEAVEFLEYNTLGSYVGEKTPCFLHIVKEEQ